MPKRWLMTKSARKRRVISHTCTFISAPGGGIANSLSSKPSRSRSLRRYSKWLAAARIVEKDVGDLFALQHATQLLLGELNSRCALGPIGGRDGEQIRILLAVGGSRRVDPRADAGDLVFVQQWRQSLGMWRTVNGHHHGAFIPHAPIGFHARLDFVSVIDFHNADGVTPQHRPCCLPA